LGLGVALLLLGVVLVFGNRFENGNQSYTFANEPVLIEGFDLNLSQDFSTPTRIVIPSLSIDLVVVNSKIINGYWEVFEDSAGWGEGSGVPGRLGNQVIFAHAREGLFLPLREIKLEQTIYVLTGSNWYSYKVNEIKEVYPNQTEVIAPSEDEMLTLYTCSGYKDSKRLIITAKRNTP
jgi:sortase A